MRAVTQTAIDLAKTFEGFKPARYYDLAGNPTIGYGHLILAGSPYWDETLTEPEGEALLAQDMATKAAAPLCELASAEIIAALSDNRYSALLDFVFNEGIGHFATSTMWHLIQQNLLSQVGDEFGKWVYAGGKIQQGLVKRRAAEAALWNE